MHKHGASWRSLQIRVLRRLGRYPAHPSWVVIINHEPLTSPTSIEPPGTIRRTDTWTGHAEDATRTGRWVFSNTRTMSGLTAESSVGRGLLHRSPHKRWRWACLPPIQPLLLCHNAPRSMPIIPPSISTWQRIRFTFPWSSLNSIPRASFHEAGAARWSTCTLNEHHTLRCCIVWSRSRPAHHSGLWSISG